MSLCPASWATEAVYPRRSAFAGGAFARPARASSPPASKWPTQERALTSATPRSHHSRMRSLRAIAGNSSGVPWKLISSSAPAPRPRAGHRRRARLYATWVEMGGEGIVLKAPASPYRPGERSPAWLKLKPKLRLKVVVAGGSTKWIPWGDWGQAVVLEIAYVHPRTPQVRPHPPSRPDRARSPVRADD